MAKKIFLLILTAWFCSGCASTNYFPLKNQKYFSAEKPIKRRVFIMPYAVDIYTFLDTMNPKEKLDAKTKAAQEFVLDALKKELVEKGYQVAGHITIDDLDDTKKVDEDLDFSIAENFEELNSAVYSIKANLNDEKGIGFDYSLGLRARDLAERLPERPDLLLFVVANGYVMNLSCLENNALTTMEAIFTLGLSKLTPCMEDSMLLEAKLIDAQSGDIIFVDTAYGYSQSFLIQKHIDAVAKNLFMKFPLPGE